MDQMTLAHQIEVDEQADDARGGGERTLSLYVAKPDEERAKQAIQTLELGELSQSSEDGEADGESEESGLSRRVSLVGNAIGIIVTALLLLRIVFQIFR